MEGLGNLVFLALLIGVFYFLLIRPQKRRVEQHRNLIESIQVGDDIITIGGLYGTVRSIGEDQMEIEVSPGTTLKFTKAAIARRVGEEPDATETSADETADVGRTSE